MHSAHHPKEVLVAQVEYKLTEFQDFLAKSALIPSSQRQVVLGIRRALKHLGPDRLTNPEELMLYRMSMPESTRRLFGYGWSKFQPYMAKIGQDLPDLPKMPAFKIVHPLWADLTDLSAQLNVHGIERLRWQDVIGTSDPDIVEKPARRAFEFITGRAPLEIDWLVPRDASAESPMPYWMIDTILRTNPTERDKQIEMSIFRIHQLATRLGIGPTDLRTIHSEINVAMASATGRRRIGRLDALEIDYAGPWNPGNQDLVMSVLGGAKLREVPEDKRIDISGPVIVLREAINRTGSGATLD